MEIGSMISLISINNKNINYMDYNINNALENLEKNLQKVDSAREQVEKTVNAYSQLQGKVEVCTNCFHDLASSVEALISIAKEHRNSISTEMNSSLVSIKESCDKINKSFDDSCGKAASNFDEKATKSVIQLNENIDSLKRQISGLDSIEKSFALSMDQIRSLKIKIENIAENLDSSQSSQDDLLNAIDNNVNECKRMIETVTKGLLRKQEELQTLIGTKSSEVSSCINESSSKTQKLLSESKDSITQQNNINAKMIAKSHKLIYCIIALIVIDIVMHFII